MIDIRRQGAVAVLELCHGKVNAIDIELCEALVLRLDELRADSAASALVLTGRGRAFSAGVDLLRVIHGGRSYVERFIPALVAAFDALFAFPKPLVAAINGHAIAGGCVFACAADRRLLAMGDARLGLTELQVGVPFPALALEIVRHAVAPAALPSLIYGGQTHGAEAALAQGLVDEIVEAPALLDRAVAAAQTMAGVPAPAFALAKQQLRAPALQRAHDAARAWDMQVVELWASEATREGMRSFVQRTIGARNAG